jgi:hypothetical protein
MNFVEHVHKVCTPSKIDEPTNRFGFKILIIKQGYED